jgi:hypothetical protein
MICQPHQGPIFEQAGNARQRKPAGKTTFPAIVAPMVRRIHPALT